MKKLLILSFFIFHFSFITFAYPKYEMRAVWIATVANIDFPSEKGLTAGQQQIELIRLLDMLQKDNINAVVFQARPCADAFYSSKTEPWSIWLSGKQGEAPGFDPLDFLIEEAHRRCMEVHVWINPYRALNDDDVSQFADSHTFRKKEKWFVRYGGKYYFDPGQKEVRNYLADIVDEIVENYDIDAIHCDDYFYPYPVAKEKFPDDASFRRESRGFTRRDDWRRDNVTLMVRQLQHTIKRRKPWVEFGISPFGVWRHASDDPRGSDTRRALTNYDGLYADILLWLKEDYIDYVVPQLYWEIGRSGLDYCLLADWWANNTYGHNLYIGLYASGLSENKTDAWQTPNELVRQMCYNRECPEDIRGEMFFSAKYFVQNIQGLNDSLKTKFYVKPAMVPFNKKNHGEESPQPEKLQWHEDKQQIFLSWDRVEEHGGKAVSYYAVYACEGEQAPEPTPDNLLGFIAENRFDISEFALNRQGVYSFTVTSVNRYRRESSVKTFLKREIK
ncbi:MAG: family 10 glycosylhydrolase [Prevotellaceae bacterium]|jgi:uncharacterized lipoprotein YddW (UPF0748 family)|nr:family 10 glycosylhydrolase [Prevotellaceae bacterium]